MIAPSILVTFTENTTVAIAFAGTSIFIPSFINCSTEYVLSPTVTSACGSPCISALFSKIDFKSVSFTVVLPSTSPVFSTEIVYVIMSPSLAGASTFVPSLVIALVFSVFIIDVLTVSLVSSLAIAKFSIVPVASSLTFTLKLTVFVPSTPSTVGSTSTNHLKDVTLSCSSLNSVKLAISSSGSTYVVPSGITSVT